MDVIEEDVLTGGELRKNKAANRLEWRIVVGAVKAGTRL
jgi:hypothetical protein